MFGKKPDSNTTLPDVIRQDHVVETAAPVDELPAVEARVPFPVRNEPRQEQEAMLRYRDAALETEDFQQAKHRLIELLIEKMNVDSVMQIAEADRRARVYDICTTLIPQLAMPLNAAQVSVLKEKAVDDILGFGPLEILLNDPDVSDIMVNGAEQVYIEKQGKIHLTDVTFNNETHLLSIIQRIVTRVGRRA